MEQGEKDWISKRVEEAQRSHPASDDVALMVKKCLAGTMREHALRVRELTDLARILIDTTTAPPCEEVDK